VTIRIFNPVQAKLINQLLTELSISVLIVLGWSTALYAQDTDANPAAKPTSAQIAGDHDRAVERARKAYFQAVIEADRIETKELDDAVIDAMNNHLLDEANRVAAIKKSAEQSLERHLAESREVGSSDVKPAWLDVLWAKHFDVTARDGWQTTVDVQKGCIYRITATGTWTTDFTKGDAGCGPDGVIESGDKAGQRWMYLEGCVGSGLPFAIGAQHIFEAQEDGPLKMEMRDWYYPDNGGALQVTVEQIGHQNDQQTPVVEP
jgi:hypothetical protein